MNVFYLWNKERNKKKYRIMFKAFGLYEFLKTNDLTLLHLNVYKQQIKYNKS